MTRHRTIAGDETVRAANPLLAHAASLIGYPRSASAARSAAACRTPTRLGAARAWPSRSAPSSSSPAPGAARTLPASEFFQGYFTTAMQPGELLVEVRFPHVGGATGLGLRRAGAQGRRLRRGRRGGRGHGARGTIESAAHRARRRRRAARRGAAAAEGALRARRPTAESVAAAAAAISAQVTADAVRDAAFASHVAGVLGRRPSPTPSSGRGAAHDAAHDHAPRSTATSARARPSRARCSSDFLREDLGLTGTHVGCEHGVCGACTVLLDGEPVRSCLLFAVQATGPRSRRSRALAPTATTLHPVQAAFRDSTRFQCGFCTPGFVLTADGAAASENPSPDRGRDPRGAVGQHLPLHGLRVASSTPCCTPAELMGAAAMTDVVDTAAAVLRREREAHRGPALPHRPRPLRRRHRAAGHAARGVRAQRVRARRHRLDRHRAQRSRCRACTPSSPAPTSATAGPADHVQLDVSRRGSPRAHAALSADRVRLVGETDRARRCRRPLRRRGRRRPGRGRLRRRSDRSLRSVDAAIDPSARRSARRGEQLLRQARTSRSASSTGCSTRRTPCSTAT